MPCAVESSFYCILLHFCGLSMSFSMFWSFTHFPPVSLFPENCEPKKIAQDVWFVIDMSGFRNDVKSENATFEHRSLFLVAGATLAIEQYAYVQYSVLALHCPKTCLRNHISFVNLVISKSSGWVFGGAALHKCPVTRPIFKVKSIVSCKAVW